LLNFVKVIPKTLLVPFFSGHGVEIEVELSAYSMPKYTENVLISPILCTQSVKQGQEIKRWCQNFH